MKDFRPYGERETGFEPATPTLARLYSTPEPLAHFRCELTCRINNRNYTITFLTCQSFFSCFFIVLNLFNPFSIFTVHNRHSSLLLLLRLRNRPRCHNTDPRRPCIHAYHIRTDLCPPEQLSESGRKPYHGQSLVLALMLLQAAVLSFESVLMFL